MPWHKVRDGVDVKLLPQDNEAYILAQSRDRICKERSMRRRQLKRLWKRLHELEEMEPTRDQLLLKLGAAKQQSPSAWRFVKIDIPEEDGPFRFSLRKDRLRTARRREGRYLLRTNLVGRDPAEMWEFYTQLVHVEEAFKNLKGDLALRPIHHQKEGRIEAHIFVAFVAYALHVDPATSSAQSGARLNSPCCPGKVRRRPDDRPPSPDHGRSQDNYVALYPAGAGPSDPAQTTAAVFPRSAASPYDGQGRLR